MGMSIYLFLTSLLSYPNVSCMNFAALFLLVIRI
jgi:hypothetical protein